MDALQRDKMRRVQGVTVIEYAVCTDARERVRERERQPSRHRENRLRRKFPAILKEGASLANYGSFSIYVPLNTDGTAVKATAKIKKASISG